MPKDMQNHEPATRTTRRSTKEVTRRKKKDPNAPKRALSSYMHFANAERPKILKEQEDVEDDKKLTFGGVGKELGARWKALTPDDKKIYEAQAEQDKVRYQQEMEVYNADHE